MKVIYTVGISASGKTTWANQFVAEKSKIGEQWAIVSRDDFRKNLLVEKTNGECRELVWSKWNWKWESEITEGVEKYISWLVSYSQMDGFIIADTNLNVKRLNAHKSKMIWDYGIDPKDIEVKYFPITIEEAWARDAARKNGVGHSVIAKQMEQWNEMMKPFVAMFRHHPNLPSVVLCDIDGTLAHMNGKRKPFEWSKVGLDDVDNLVREIVVGLAGRVDIVLMSGRDEVCRPETEEWINTHKIPYSELHMRSNNDMRKDVVVKEELFWKHVAPFFNVVGVIDDRPSVCRMWRNLGLKVMQVGNPYIEF
jgi:hypothetical protein